MECLSNIWAYILEDQSITLGVPCNHYKLQKTSPSQAMLDFIYHFPILNPSYYIN